jgi:hypothetical protein
MVSVDEGRSFLQVEVVGLNAYTVPDSSRGVIAAPPRFNVSSTTSTRKLSTYSTKDVNLSIEYSGCMSHSCLRDFTFSLDFLIFPGQEVDAVYRGGYWFPRLDFTISISLSFRMMGKAHPPKMYTLSFMTETLCEDRNRAGPSTLVQRAFTIIV